MCIEKNMKILVTFVARELYLAQVNVKPFEFQENEESRVNNP